MEFKELPKELQNIINYKCDFYKDCPNFKEIIRVYITKPLLQSYKDYRLMLIVKYSAYNNDKSFFISKLASGINVDYRFNKFKEFKNLVNLINNKDYKILITYHNNNVYQCGLTNVKIEWKDL